MAEQHTQVGALEYQYWNSSMPRGGYTVEQALVQAEDILTSGTLATTLDMQGVESPGIEASKFSLTLSYAGLKYGIFEVKTRRSNASCVLALPRSEELTPMLEKDFEDMVFAREQVMQAGMPIFIPRVYSLTGNAWTSGFTVEFLKDHLGAISVFEPEVYMEKGIAVPVVTTNAPAEVEQNRTGQRRLPTTTTWKSNVDMDNYASNQQRAHLEVAKRLAILHELTGGTPADFSMMAGDIMVNPSQDDFDPQLTTISGGLHRLSKEQFLAYLSKHTEKMNVPGLGIVPYQPFRNVAQSAITQVGEMIQQIRL